MSLEVVFKLQLSLPLHQINEYQLIESGTEAITIYVKTVEEIDAWAKLADNLTTQLHRIREFMLRDSVSPMQSPQLEPPGALQVKSVQPRQTVVTPNATKVPATTRRKPRIFLTPEQEAELRKDYISGKLSVREIGEHYNVSKSTVYRIASQKG